MYSIGQSARNGSVVVLMAITVALVGACMSPALSVDRAPAPAMSELSEDMVRNAAYTLPDLGAFQLRAGSYEHKTGEGATQVSQVRFETAAFGDLNGDGAQDAAVVLSQQMGGSGSFIHLAATLNKNGIPVQAAVTSLGDRARIKSLAVRDGQIVVDVLSFGPADPMCCPSQLATRTYGLSGQALTLIGTVTLSSGAGAGIPATTAAPTAAIPTPRPVTTAAADYRNASYQIEGRVVTLVNGLAEFEAAPGSAARIVTRYFGNVATGDLNGDGTADVAFLLTQSGGGSGTFYYVVAALKTTAGYVGTNAVLLGDRIAPQTTELRDGSLTVNYADRKPGEAMTTSPSLGVSKYLRVVDGKLTVVSR